METSPILFVVAIVIGIMLQIVVRFSNRSMGKWGAFALTILKDAALLCLQILLIFIFSGGREDRTGHTGCIIASCCTFGFAVAVVLLQTLFKRRYPLSDEQKMRLTEM